MCIYIHIQTQISCMSGFGSVISCYFETYTVADIVGLESVEGTGKARFSDDFLED